MRYKTMKKWIAFLMAAVISLSLAACGDSLGTINYEVQTNQIANGSCTDTIVWTLYSDGVLRLSGTGEIGDYEKGANNQPWADYRNRITALVIEDGITRIGDRAFQSCSYMESAVIGKDVASIGEWAFQNCYALTDVQLQPEVSLENGAFRSTPAELDVSAAISTCYTNSRYDSALSRVERTGNYREDIIHIALSQVGYHEGDSADDYNGGNTGGSGDYTEYGRYLGSIGGAWCSEFASWCICMAEVPTQIVAISRSANAADFTKDSSAVWYTWDQTVYGGGHYTPRTGDILLWAWDNNRHGTEENLSHTSILREINKKNSGSVILNTIDGNSNNRVEECKYEVNPTAGSLIGRTGRLCYIIAPDYESGNNEYYRGRCY